MPECVLAFGVFPFVETEGSVLVDGAGEIPLLVIYCGGEHVAGQLRRQAFGYLQWSDAALILLYAAVGKGNVD